MINKALQLDCPDPAETYSSSPHLYEELGIPTEAVGSIGAARKPRGARPENRDETGSAPPIPVRASVRPCPIPPAHPQWPVRRWAPGEGAS